MFARWSQENFFKYMSKNFAIDTLISYCKQMISDTAELINPLWRARYKKFKSLTGKLKRLEAKFGELTYEAEADLADEKQVNRYTEKKAQLQEI
ncbi:MAG: putative transposase [Bacteroidota bacterium]